MHSGGNGRMNSADSLRGRRVVVTGGTAGVGRATALRLAAAGAKVVVLARDLAALDGLVEEAAAEAGEVVAIGCDVADSAAVLDAANRAAEVFGGIDVWINDAMATVFARVDEITPEEFQRITAVCYLGLVHGTMAALRHMKPNNSGVIVQIGSALAYRGIPLQAAYCGAKHAARGFTDGLRAELLHDGSGIALTTVHLPGMNTPQFEWARSRYSRRQRPAGRVYQPEVAARAVERAILRPAREYWVSGQTAAMIIANMAAPSIADRYLARTAVEGQFMAEHAAPGREDNLFTPISGRGLHRSHGAFSAEARPEAFTLAAVPTVLGVAAVVLLAAAGLGFALGAALG